MLDSLPSVCLWHHLQLPCWGCGTLRAASAALHGEWLRAWGYNHNVVIALPLAVGVVAAKAWGMVREWEGE